VAATQLKQQKLWAKDVLQNTNRTQAAEMAERCRFLSLVTLTLDLDLQSGLSQEPNTSSVSPSHTISPRLRPTSVPSGILIHPAVSPQQT